MLVVWKSHWYVDYYTGRPRELAAVSSRKVAASPRIEDHLHSPCHVTSYPRLRQAGVEPVTEPPKLYANSGDPAFYKWWVYLWVNHFSAGKNCFPDKLRCSPNNILRPEFLRSSTLWLDIGPHNELHCENSLS